MRSTTAYRLVKRVFQDLPVTEMLPVMSEVIGHLDLLEDESRVGIEEGAAGRRYRLA